MSNTRIAWLSPGDPPDAFPPVELALIEPDGLLAAGGDLSVARLLEAYRRGIFPWFDAGQPILWWSPDPRCVLVPTDLHLSRRFLRTLRNGREEISYDLAFDAVVEACAAPRKGQPGTWITAEMQSAYVELHRLGWAHSIEVWHDERLVGGLYGLAIGRLFFAESMFSGETGGSKIALAALCARLEENGFPLIDCQVASAHLMTLGARLMARREFSAVLADHAADRQRFDAWPADRRPARELLPALAEYGQ